MPNRGRGRRQSDRALSSRWPRSTIDLHAHTTASDGLLSPTQLVEFAAVRGVQTLAITDHDTTDGVAEGVRAGKALGVLVVPGIELNTSVDGQEIHVLGYGLDYLSSDLQAFLQRRRTERERRVERLVEILAGLQMHIDLEQIRAAATGAALGRPHIARALVAAGYAHTSQEAFDRWLGTGRPAHVAREEFPPDVAARIICRFGGWPVLAHPASLIDLESWVALLAGCGLAGLECWYPGYRPAVTRALMTLARRYDLVPTGGSDFHGSDLKRGTPLGGVSVAPDTLTRLTAGSRVCNDGAVQRTPS